MPSAQVFAVSNLLYPDTLNGKRVMFANFSKYGASDAGGGVMILGVSGVRMRIHALTCTAGSATTFTLWRDTTTMYGPINLGASATIVLPFSPVGWFQGSHGQGINLWTNLANTVVGVVVYSEVD